MLAQLRMLKMTQGKVRARIQTTGKVGKTYEERVRVKETLYRGTLKAWLRNYFSVSVTFHEWC